jgi:Lipocalin-like domain
MSDDPRNAIVGAWRLVHSVEYGPDGAPHYPFGQNAVGCIIYSESGVMAVQITRRERSEDAERLPGGASENLAYFGRYEVDTEKQLVRHFLEGQLHPGRHPDILERKYTFYDDKLSLRPWNDGTNREILWQRT